MDFYLIIWIIIGSLAAAVPVTLVKKYTENKDFTYIILSMVSFGVLVYVYSVILKNRSIIIICPIIKVISILFVVLFGYFFFKNKIDAKITLGILFGIASIYLLSTEM
jgi:uncharacterized membrane protein